VAVAAAQRRWSLGLVAAMVPKRWAGGVLPCARAAERACLSQVSEGEISPGLNLNADGDEPGTDHSFMALIPHATLELC
jgi:hypothetical protein